MSSIKRFDYNAMKRQLSDTTSSSTPEYKPVVEVVTADTIDAHNISGNTDESSDTAIQVNTSDDSANGDFESDDDSVEFEIDDTPVDSNIESEEKSKSVVNEVFVDPTDGFKDVFDSGVNTDVDIADFDDFDTSVESDVESNIDDTDDVVTKEDVVDEDNIGMDEPETDEALLRKQTAQHNQKNKPKPATNFVYDKSTSENSILKNFPKSILALARSCFPEEAIQNNSEAVAAYIYCKEGCPSDVNVPQSIKNLAKKYNKDGVTTEELQDTFESSLQDVDKRLKELLRIANAIELAVAYDTCDRIGFRVKDQNEPGEIEFLEKSVTDFIKRLDDQSKLNQSRISARHGREFR